MKFLNEEDVKADKEFRTNVWSFIINPIPSERREDYLKQIKGKGFRNPNPDFNEHNLKFDIEYLNTIGGSIALLPLELSYEYADRLCRKSVDEEDGIVERSFINQVIDENMLTDVDATSIGNMAYIALNSKNDIAKKKAFDVLEKFMHHYLDKLLNNVVESANSRPIQ